MRIRVRDERNRAALFTACTLLATVVLRPNVVLGAESKTTAPPRGPAFFLQYVARSGCPSREEFVESVLRRVSRVPTPGTATRLEFQVELAESGDLAVGSLSVRGTGASTDEVARKVPAAACADVADALALMAALVVEEQQAAQRAQAASHPVRVERVRSVAVGEQATGAPAERGRTFVAEVSSREGVDEEAAARRAPRLGGAAAAGVEWGPASSEMPAFRMGAALQFAPRSVFAPSFLLTLVYGETSVTMPEGGAVFRLLTSRFIACPVQLRVGWAKLDGCAVTDAGSLRASGDDGTFWLAAGGGVRAQVSLSQFLKLEALWDARAPMRNYRFVSAQTNRLVHEVPAWATSASIGLSAWGL